MDEDMFKEYQKNLENLSKAINYLKYVYNENSIMTDNINFESAKVYVINQVDVILDFINHCDANVKDNILKALDKKTIEDKALFISSKEFEDSEDITYIVLVNINDQEFEGDNLTLVHSKNLRALSLFIEELSNLTVEEIEEQFKPKNKK